MSDPDIVERLRYGLQIDNGNQVIGRPPTMLHHPLLDEAAQLIERLRAAAIVDADRLRRATMPIPPEPEPDPC